MSAPEAESQPIIELRGLAKTYHSAEVPVHALLPTSLSISPGCFTAILGQSGSGKSTLLNLLGLLDKPTAGEYWLGGKLVSNLGENAMADIRCLRIGFVFQQFNLFPSLTVRENVCVPMRYADIPRKEMLARAEAMLARVGLSDRLAHRPSQLSGGQCQRVAIARALVNRPSIILADEPTGNLDQKTGTEIMALFHELVAEGVTILMVTHNPDYKKEVHRVITMRDGLVVES